MILIVGGAYQGKGAYARENFGEDYDVINSYQLRVKGQLKAGENPMEKVQRLVAEKKAEGVFDRLVIISDETGCGVVPLDAFERLYREQAGKVSCYLAKEADSVIRVICGIGKKIK